MKTDFAHLTVEAAQCMTGTQQERINFALSDHWRPYPRANQILRALGDLMNAPQVQRTPNVLMVGDSDNGKSSIITRFAAMHAPMVGPDGILISPFVAMEMPSKPKESRFWSELLSALLIAHKPTDPVQDLQNQALEVLRLIKCRMLSIDEGHNILCGSAAEQRQILVVLKTLSNKLRIPIVCVGIRTAVRALHTDNQLASRFEPLPLPRWQLNHEYLRLLASLEQLLPLEKPSNLAARDLAPEIHRMSGGTIGGTTKVLRRATIHAIKEGHEVINKDTLKAIEWTSLVDYEQHAMG